MLKETHQLLQKIKETIPFENVTSVFLFEEDLTVQTFFRKDDIPYYFKYHFSKTDVNILDEELINFYIRKLKKFYSNIKLYDLEESDLVNQTIVENYNYINNPKERKENGNGNNGK